jgi:hypothetical protein
MAGDENPRRGDAPPQSFTLASVARHLDISVDSLQRLRRRFGHYLGPEAMAAEPHFSNADIAAIVTIQKLLAQGYDDEQIDEHLTPLSNLITTPRVRPACLKLWVMCLTPSSTANRRCLTGKLACAI